MLGMERNSFSSLQQAGLLAFDQVRSIGSPVTSHLVSHHRLLQPRICAVALGTLHQRLERAHAPPDIPAMPLEPAIEQIEPGPIDPGTDQLRVVDRSLRQPADLEGAEPLPDGAGQLGAGPARRPPGGLLPARWNRACRL